MRGPQAASGEREVLVDLLDAAEELLLGKQLDAITVDEVVNGAGVSKARSTCTSRSGS